MRTLELVVTATAALALTLSFSACGAAPDRHATLQRLRAAIEEEVATPNVLEDHNRLVESVSSDRTLEGMFESEVQEALGRGEDCGVRPLCREHDFVESDWVYDVGRQPGDPSLPAGPTLIIGFDRTGRVDRTYTLSRH